MLPDRSTDPTIRAHLKAVLTILGHRLGIQPKWWLGRPVRATIRPVSWGDGYALAIQHTEGVEWIDLPGRTRVYDHPDKPEFDATAAALAARGLAWVLPWELDERGNLTAPVTPLRKDTDR